MARNTQRPLPKLDSLRIQELGWSECSDHYRAYASILQAEKRAITSEAEGELVSIRVAGYLLLEFVAQSGIFGVQPSAALVRWLTSPPQDSECNQHDVIINTGTILRDKFIRVFRTTNTMYSQPSSHPSRPSPSFDTLEDMIKDSMETTGKDYRTSKNKALARDGYRCVITGIFNAASVEHFPELVQSSSALVLSLETAHIFNESTIQGIDPAVSEDSQDKLLNKTRTATGALSILESFGFSKFTNAFKGAGGVHEVWNLLTLQWDLRTFFDRLELWFEHTEKVHRYKVCTLHGPQETFICRIFVGGDRHINGAPTFVEFSAQYEEAPPPDPLLLALHATCARVAHMSGAAEFFARIERDVEEMSVLAFDGSSASLLSNLLCPYAVIRGVG